MTEKRNIHALIEKEAPSLNNLLDPNDVKEFKEDLITEKVVKEFLSSLSKKEPTLNINFKKNDIVIMGIGGHESMCIDILLEQNEFNLVGFIDKIETSDIKRPLS
jgi:hypothetical protein